MARPPQTLEQYRRNGSDTPDRDIEREVTVDQSAPQTSLDAPAFEVADEFSVRGVADALIADHYPDLLEAALLFLMDGKQHRRGGHVVVTRTVKLTPLQRFLASNLQEVGAGADFAVLIDRKSWLAHTDAKWREAALDTALAYCELEQTEEGNDRWKLRQPDFTGFTEILGRHGAWDEPLQAMVVTARQLSLPIEVPELPNA
jgi:hypothetical protein